MSAALVALLKKLAIALGKKAVTAVSKGIKHGLNNLKSLVQENLSKNTRAAESGGKKKKISKIAVVIVTILSLLFGGLGSSLFIVAAAVATPVVAVISMIQAVFADSSELNSAIATYWADYQADYGNDYEIATATDAQIMVFLLEYDDFWEEVKAYFQFDRETMQAICSAAQEQYYPLYPVDVQVQLATLNTESGETVYASTYCYLDTGNHYLSWEALYSLLCGCTTGSNIASATIEQVAGNLSPVCSDVKEPNAVVYSWDMVSAGEYMEDTGIPVSGNTSVYQIIAGTRRDGSSSEFLFEGKAVSVADLTFTMRSPLYILHSEETADIWSGTLAYTDGEIVFTASDERILTVLKNAGFALDAEAAVTAALNTPGGYTTARSLSLVISDGTVTVPPSTNTLLSTVLAAFSGQEDILELLLESLGINASGIFGDSDYTNFETTDDYVIFESFNGGPEIIWWSQNWYPNEPNVNGTIKGSGCGPSSMAIVYSSLTGDVCNPPQMSKWAQTHGSCDANYGYLSSSGAAYPGLFTTGSTELGLRLDYVGTGSSALGNALPYLNDGDLIVCLVGNGSKTPIYSGDGHFLVIRGYTSDGKLLLADPAKTAEGNTQTYNVSDMENILNRSAVGRTGYVWAIGYDGVRQNPSK